MLTRRAFHQRLIATFAAAVLPLPGFAATQAADVFLNRLTFGATPQDRAAFAGNVCGYYIGRAAGPAIFDKPKSRLFKPQLVARTQGFFD